MRLAARYGPEMPLDRVLADLAHDCPHWRSNPRRYEPRCGARLEDLDRLRPHDVPPGDQPHRRREPAREDLPQPRRRVPEASGRYPMLSNWTAPRIAVSCAKCGRRDVVETEAVRRAMGDVTLVEVRLALTADCPRALAKAFSDWCAGLLTPGD